MKTAYSFVTLRYVHDVATGEFINIGVAMYVPDQKYIGGMFNTRYGRISKLFGEIDGDYYRGLIRYIDARFDELASKLKSELPLNGIPGDILQVAKEVLPPDDSSLQWSEAGGGLTEEPAKTLEDLYVRFVERYEGRALKPTRDEGEVWRVFKRELEVRRVLSHLHPKRIIAKDYDYEFEHAWKNQKWHMLEPISFDLLEADSILDKANRWLGRIVSLKESPEPFKMHVLLGEPSLERLRPAFVKAENILNKMPCEKQFVREGEASTFSEFLSEEIMNHEQFAQ